MPARKLKLDELNRISAERFKNAEKTSIVVVLDNIRSLHNVGSAFRTADAFRLEKIFLCGITGTPPNRELHKTALGAEDSVEWKYAENTEDAVNELRNQGFKIVAVEQTDKSIQLQQFAPDKNDKYCFIFGNEVFGVGEDALMLSDFSIEIPQFGTKHSFNVSVSLGIVLWHTFLKTGAFEKLS